MATAQGGAYTGHDPVSVFRFDVYIDDKHLGTFTECTLPTVEWETQEVKEGGLNSWVHQLLGRRKAARCTLKNGLTRRHELVPLYYSLMTGGPLKADDRKKISIILRDGQRSPLMRWDLSNAYAIKVNWPTLKTGDNTVAVQSIELVCEAVTSEPVP